MRKTEFLISGMDCPTEEQIIRLKLEHEAGVKHLSFFLKERRLEVYHTEGIEPWILKNLESLNLGAVRTGSYEATDAELNIDSGANLERKVLWIVLGVNFIFFVGEMVFGLLSGSMGLVADSLDMLADSFVYALALLAVGSTIVLKKRVAKVSGYLQLFLAIIGFAEVIRRFLGNEIIPDFLTMIIVSGLALVANVYCLLLLQRARSNEAHMQASIIFTSNDIFINLGVIIAGALVWYLESSIPDLIVGSLVFVIVLRGAWRILKLSR